MQIEELREIFRRNLKCRREELGLTQADVAERSGIHQALISQYERGSKIPSMENLARLSTALQIKPDILLRDSYVERLPA